MNVQLYPPAGAAAPLTYVRHGFVTPNAAVPLTIPYTSQLWAAAACAPTFVGFIELVRVPVG